MNVLLVRPRPDKNTINLQSFMICEPLELEYVCSYLEQFGHNVTILDMIVEKKPFVSYLADGDYSAVGFTGYLPHVHIIKQYAKEVKTFNAAIKTVVGGIHAEVVPTDFENGNIDFILKCSALGAFKSILDHIDKPKETIKAMIDGIWQDSSKEYAVDLSTQFPFPNRSKTEKYRKYYNYVYHDKCATIKTSFGCPYNCEFCFCVQITKSQYAVRELNDVINEIKEINEQNIFIVDDDFLVDVNRIQMFCKLIKENGIKKNFILFGRADFIAAHEDTIILLKEAGLHAVFIGIESFTENELKQLNKKTTVEMNVKAVKFLESIDINCYCGIIAGMDWGKKDFDNLIRYLNTFKHPMVNIQPISPIPGTPLYEKTADKITEKRDKYEVWDMAHVLFTPEKMSVRKFYYNIFRAYYKTAVKPGMHVFIVKKYGCKVYIRTLIGVFHVSVQYIKLIMTGR